MEDHVWWVSGRETYELGGVRSAERSVTGSDRTRSWWCKQEKVEVGWRTNKKMETGPHTEHRDEPLWEGAGRVSRRSLREFMQIDNHRALEVGHVSEGLRSFEVRSRKDNKDTQR